MSNDHYLTAHQSLVNYYTKNQTSSATEISTSFVNYNSQLTGYSKTIEYNSTAKKIYLKNGSKTLGTVDCTDFIKDGMLSSAELCGSVLVFKFNTDAGTTPISVNLSSFANVYSAGYGLNLKDYQFNIDTSKIAEVSDLIVYE